MATQIFVNEKPTRCISEFDFLHDPNDKNSKLGTGSFASVKLAKDRKSGKLHALKMVALHPSKATSSDLHNIRTEVSIHKKMDHPNIIKFYDYCQKEHNVYLVLDYAENGNLYSYIHKRKSLNQDEIFRFFHQTCLAIQYLHQNDVLHRDIKPENLLLDKSHNIKLCDFGWSTRRITEKRLTFCGTYEYMAPEIVHKKPYDYRVDIWSLGVLLYELIHREAPYKGRSLSEISKSLAKPHITFSSNTHPEAKDLIQKILKANPNERLPIEQILSHPWVKLHLPKNSNTEVHVTEIVSPRETKSHNFHNVYAESSKHQLRKNKENFMSEILTSIDNGVVGEIAPPQSKRNLNPHLYNSFAGTTFREKDTERLKEREKLREYGVGVSAENTILNHSDSQKRKPLQEFIANAQLKTISENQVSARGHTKSSSSLTGSILDKLILDERKTPSSRTNNKKIFENTILSPNIKTKVNTIVYNLNSHTTTHKSSRDVSSLFGSKVASQHTTRHGYSGITSPIRHYDQQLSSSQKLDILTISHAKPDARADDALQVSTSSSSNTSKARIDIEGTRRVKTPNNMKSNFQIKLNLPKGDDVPPFSSPMSNANRTARSKLDARSPEPTNFRNNPLYMSHKFSSGELVKSPLSKRPENIFSGEHENRVRSSKDGLGFSFNNFYKGLDYKKKQSYKFNGELNTGSHKTLLKERRYEQKDNKREALRDKENQFIFKEEPLRNWAF